MIPRLALVFVLVASSSRAESSAVSEASDAPRARTVPHYQSSCASCSATGLMDSGFDGFRAHVAAVDASDPAARLFQRQRQAEAVAVSGAAIGLALAGTGLLIVRGSCQTEGPARILKRVNFTDCGVSTEQLIFAGAGASMLLLGGVGFFALRPNEPDAVSAINAFNDSHPAAPFQLGGASTGVSITGGDRPLFLDPQVLVPLGASVVGIVATGIAMSEGQRNRIILEADAWDSLAEAKALTDAAIAADRTTWVLAGLSTVSAGLTSYFIAQPARTPAVQIAAGPGSVAIYGRFE